MYSLGFDSRGLKNEDEIESLRTISKEGAKIKDDITSTNYKHLGALGKDLYYKLGWGEHEYESYVSRTKKHAKKAIKKKF